jgi:hypothetical protein
MEWCDDRLLEGLTAESVLTDANIIYEVSPLLRQTFHEFGFLSTRWPVWAKAYYYRQRDQKQSRPAAVRALAYKWIRIIFRCRKEGKLCDEQIYLQSLQSAQPPWVPLTPLSGRSL